jgi:hypothetical protein
MLLERIRFRFSMTSSLSFLSKGLGFVCFTWGDRRSSI